MTEGVDGRTYLIAAERVLTEALRMGGRRGRAFARLAHVYVERGMKIVRGQPRERPMDCVSLG